MKFRPDITEKIVHRDTKNQIKQNDLEYECICIVINDKTCSVPFNILSRVHVDRMHL